MKKDFTLRKGTLQDFSAFYSVFSKSIQNQFSHYTHLVSSFILENNYSESLFKHEIDNGDKNIYLAIDDNSIIGYLLTNKVYGGIGYGDWLAVNQEYQHQGIATQLLSLWEKNVIEDGGHGLYLWTTKNNREFYKNREFTLIGEFPHAWFGVNYLLLYKLFQPAKEENYLREYLLTQKKK